MKTLVIAAHPDLARSRVNSRWVQAIRDDGRASVRVLAEVMATHGFDVDAEQAALAGHDRIVLQFPFRWYNCPPILKTWLDEVLERGWAYGPGGTALEGKELALAVSTWSRPADYTPTGRYSRTMAELTSPFEATAQRVGMTYRPGFFVNGVGDRSDAELDDNAAALVSWLHEDGPPPH